MNLALTCSRTCYDPLTVQYLEMLLSGSSHSHGDNSIQQITVTMKPKRTPQKRSGKTKRKQENTLKRRSVNRGNAVNCRAKATNKWVGVKGFTYHWLAGMRNNNQIQTTISILTHEFLVYLLKLDIKPIIQCILTCIFTHRLTYVTYERN